MASQIGINRLYTSTDEATSPRKKQCDKCKVIAVPKGLISTRGVPSSASGQTFCPNCGHVHRAGAGRDNH